MLLLYYGSGSREVELESQFNEQFGAIKKREAARILRSQLENDAADFLDNNPFELWSGTNSFSDKFDLLYSKASIKRYLELEDQIDGNGRIEHIGQSIARAFEKLHIFIRFIAVDLDADIADEISFVAEPELNTTSATVERALNDIRVLLNASGPVSSVDRFHTLLHAYLKALCEGSSININPDASTTELIKSLREKHPKLLVKVPGEQEAGRVLKSMSAIVDALNPIRNRQSMAHANEELLEEAEAALVVNAVRTILHYLESKLA